MDNIQIEFYFLWLSGNDPNLCSTLIKIIKCFINKQNYENTPIIHIYGNSFNNKILYLSIIELLCDKNEIVYLNEVMLYNNISSWYKNTLKICFINNFQPPYFDMVQNNIIDLSKNVVCIGNTYKTSRIIKPLLKCIVTSNYDPHIFSKSFNELTTHIQFDMVEINKLKYDEMYDTIKNNKWNFIQFVCDYNM